MRKILFSMLIAGSFLNLNAQQKNESPAPKDWFHQSIDNGVYGVNTQKAYEFLKTTGRKPQTIIVGVLDSGVDLKHEDLKDIRWINPKEIAGNGKDDDRNGHIDDINAVSYTHLFSEWLADKEMVTGNLLNVLVKLMEEEIVFVKLRPKI